MKKATKRLMMVVAILLCLVLISTSVVSGVFARFVIEKNATTMVTLNKFGIEVEFEGTGSATTKKGDSVTYTNTLTMIPGDSGTITAKIKGKPTVPAIITIDVDVSYTTADFTIAKNSAFTAVTSNKVFFPIGFKVAGTQAVAPYSSSDGAAISNSIEDKIEAVLTDFTWTDGTTLTAEWPTTATEISTYKDISLEFYWPENFNTSSSQYYDEVGTYLTKSGSKGFTVTYTISVVQDPNK